MHWNYAISAFNIHFPISAQRPALIIKEIASDTLPDVNVNSSLLIPSFTLCPKGNDKSRIKRHPPSFLGITPKTIDL